MKRTYVNSNIAGIAPIYKSKIGVRFPFAISISVNLQSIHVHGEHVVITVSDAVESTSPLTTTICILQLDLLLGPCHEVLVDTFQDEVHITPYITTALDRSCIFYLQ